ncbi:cation:proton antiporter [Ferrovibrio sp.]|uniref:cation:proton antiporter domain-containing protein n=1 Tax=Ferrovibrio sp. TaxID=1917215 RepID=UPI001B5C1CB1|nr:cation:proton antiporter [Ferrovibrio sp.]MBP7062895.1 cation:proton antiporter [Ferrovibrio sp.]
MEHAAILSHLREPIVFLATAGIVVPLFHRWRVSPVLGFLFAGILIGPQGFGRLAETWPWLLHISITDHAAVQGLAEFGVIFLLFVIGLELSLGRLWAMRRLVFGLGLAQVLLTAGAIGAVAWGFGNPPGVAVLLGACLALSSTAIGMQLLAESRRQATPLGRAAFAILLFQDLAVVPILLLLGVLGGGVAQGELPWLILLTLAKAAGTLALIALAGRFLLRPLFHRAGAAKLPELFMAMILLTVLGAALITGAAGLSMALGAFLAGLMLAETEYRHAIEDSIEPFKGLLLGLFFLSVGMSIDLAVLADQAALLLASVLGLFVLKGALIGLLALLFRLGRAVAAELALLLGQAGEFAFVVVALAQSFGLMPPDVAQFMLLVTGLSMMATPLLAALGRRLARRLEGVQARRQGAAGLAGLTGSEGHIILAGYGRVGQSLGHLLDAEGLAYIALDMNPDVVAQFRQAGQPVFFGNAARPELLHRIGLHRAQALVVTLDDPAAAERIVAAARLACPELPIQARARDAAHAERLARLGAAEVVVETVEASLQLGARLLHRIGLPDDAVAHRISRAREGL